jgi:hypothetical protein
MRPFELPLLDELVEQTESDVPPELARLGRTTDEELEGTRYLYENPEALLRHMIRDQGPGRRPASPAP